MPTGSLAPAKQTDAWTTTSINLMNSCAYRPTSYFIATCCAWSVARRHPTGRNTWHARPSLHSTSLTMRTQTHAKVGQRFGHYGGKVGSSRCSARGGGHPSLHFARPARAQASPTRGDPGDDRLVGPRPATGPRACNPGRTGWQAATSGPNRSNTVDAAQRCDARHRSEDVRDAPGVRIGRTLSANGHFGVQKSIACVVHPRANVKTKKRGA